MLILGYCGACRRDELTNISVDDLQIKPDVIMVSIPKTKNDVSRLFAITEGIWIAIIKKYIDLRPNTITHKRLLITYRQGYCISSPIGINTIGKMPSIIAGYLKLPNPEEYTGHCFRRSSASHLANKGGDLVTIKRHGGWRSSAVAEGYIETSKKRKLEVTQMFSEPSTSASTMTFDSNTTAPASTSLSKVHDQGVGSVEHTYVSGQNLPANITINASGTANVTVKVFNNCTVND